MIVLPKRVSSNLFVFFLSLVLFCELCLRRYYLVEKAKDANIIGILVGTLGVGLLLFEIPYLHFSVFCAFILIGAC